VGAILSFLEPIDDDVVKAVTNSMQYTDAEARQWLLLRAMEWKNWPSFISQPVVPILLIFYPWFTVLAGVFLLDVIWAGIRYRYINVPAATNAVYLVTICKWPAAIGSAIYIFLHHNYLSGALAIAWPLGLCGLIAVPGQTGRIELMFAEKVGHVRLDSEA
jgi:hypothetical protein